MNSVNIAFKYIPIGVEFKHKGQEYIKTNLGRGYYYKEGKKVLRYFKKKTVVNTISEYFNL